MHWSFDIKIYAMLHKIPMLMCYNMIAPNCTTYLAEYGTADYPEVFLRMKVFIKNQNWNVK